MAEQKKLMVLSEPDADSCVGSWKFLRAHDLKFDDVDWEFVRSGARVDPAIVADREAIHIDTGMLYDGVRNFDHHQDDPAVRNECAATLVYKSFSEKFGDDRIYKTIADYVLKVDHGQSKEASELIRGSQFYAILRDLSVFLHALKYTENRKERIRLGHKLLDCFYEAAKNELQIADELGPMSKAETPFGNVLFGETKRDHKELRAFARHHLYGHIDILIVGYADNSVGITLIGNKERWRLNLRVVKDMMIRNFPDIASGRVFLHNNGFVLYVHPKDGHKDSVPTVDELFDIARKAYAAS